MRDINKAVAKMAVEDPLAWPILTLPYFFQFNGRPVTLKKHFYTEPFYRLENIPPMTTYMTGRQVGKSIALTMQSYLRGWLKDHWHLLVFTPLHSQVSYLSDTYFSPLGRDSRVWNKFFNPSTCKFNVLHRTFTNGSSVIFSYAFNNADRIRGKSVDAISGDEMQDFDFEFLPIVRSCMDAREHVGVQQFTGTPKTLDNTLTVLFEEGSQAEWVTKCGHCGHYNVPAIDQDLLNMIQPDGVSCGKCKKTINPSEGHWVHAHPERRLTHASYHVPQIICPTHYAIREKWDLLFHKSKTQEKHTFFNEILGVPCDTGQKLVSITELKAACVLPVDCTDIESVKEYCARRYIHKILCVDWSGGGVDYQSFTGIALAGIRGDGVIEVPFMKILPYTTNHSQEAALVKEYALALNAEMIAHDFSGAGNVRETLLIQSGWPYERVIPITLTRTSQQKAILSYEAPATEDVRHSYKLDKGRSLVLCCTLIKSGGILFPKYDGCKDEVTHFLNLIEHYIERPTSGPVFSITKVPKQPDDIAQAINLGVCSLFHIVGHWPNISQQFDTRFSNNQTEIPEDQNV